MKLELSDLQSLKDSGILAALALYLLKSLWDIIIGSAKRRLRALEANTKAIVGLEYQMKELKETVLLIPKIKQDITAAHQKIRDLDKKLQN